MTLVYRSIDVDQTKARRIPVGCRFPYPEVVILVIRKRVIMFSCRYAARFRVWDRGNAAFFGLTIGPRFATRHQNLNLSSGTTSLPLIRPIQDPYNKAMAPLAVDAPGKVAVILGGNGIS